MISDEKRAKKPYAIPVQYVPYDTLRDQYIRDLLVELKRDMKELDIEVIGEYISWSPNMELIMLC